LRACFLWTETYLTSFMVAAVSLDLEISVVCMDSEAKGVGVAASCALVAK
jgi:hypothetical protein